MGDSNMAGSPVDARLAATRHRGAFGLGGVDALREFYSPAAMASAHYEWRTLPITMKMLRALRDLAMSCPPVVSPNDASVQYGISMGLSMAANLLDDPALVVKGLFGTDVDATQGPLDETFEEA